MQYHALALARRGAQVSLIGYAGAPVVSALAAHPEVRIYRLAPSTSMLGAGGLALRSFTSGTLDRVRLTWRLLWLLGVIIPRADVLLVQNPPALPTLPTALAIAWLRRSRLVIDWHNLSWSVLAMRLGSAHWLVRITRRLERVCARGASRHITVSHALRSELAASWKLLDPVVVYDRPAECFVPLDPRRRDAERRRLLGAHCEAFVIVSSTSWTPDEDFELLLDAAETCEQALAAASGSSHKTRVLILVTGDGPGRQPFEARLRSRTSSWVRIETRWLSPDDYPVLLAAADLGVCLHRSTSGLDLPMKLADMLGAALPVCAFDYGPAVRERLVDGRNGRLFSSSAELASLILEMHQGFPASPALTALRRQTLESDRTGWDHQWGTDAGPVVLGTPPEA